jgi:hypothetical protein
MDEREPKRRDEMDYQEHEKTYRLFITLTQWGAATVAIVLILMAIFLL